MLHSIVNMKLRNEKQTLAHFCSNYQLEQTILLQRLENNGLTYNAGQNQFKQKNG